MIVTTLREGTSRFSLLAVCAVTILATHCPSVLAQSRDPYRERRASMVTNYVEKEGVRSERVIASLKLVPRHEFVPTNLRAQAYHDMALAIGHKQTISPPYIVGYMTESIDPQPTDRVLEIGTGSGYQAAVLANIVKDVYTIEIVEPLGKQADERLRRLGYKNVHTRIGDGYQGWAEHAPFDKIIVTCSPENVPKPLVEQLKEGGKMIVPLGERYSQVFHLFEKKDGNLVATKLIPTLFVPMTGISEDLRQIKPDPVHPEIHNGGFEFDDNKDDLADGWHYQRLMTRVNENAPEGKFCALFENHEPGRIAQALQGMAADGSKIASLKITFRYKLQDIRQGSDGGEQPAVMIHFYDDQRRQIGDTAIGPWLGTNDWETVVRVIPVPVKTRELIFRVGMNGAVGKMWVDDFSMTPQLK